MVEALKAIDPATLSLDDMREFLGKFVVGNASGGRFWDVITCLRGPDSPSERADQTSSESSAAYAARRKRKRETVEVIRGKALLGAVGGSARYRTDIDYVELPPTSEWDHFDKHVDRAARVLGIKVKIKGEDLAVLPKGATMVKPVGEANEPGFPVQTDGWSGSQVIPSQDPSKWSGVQYWTIDKFGKIKVSTNPPTP